MAQQITKPLARAIMLGAVCALSACATVAPPSPVSVTRFHDAAALSQIGQGVVFIESAPGLEGASLELAPYKAAIAAELTALGYREGTRAEANAIAQVAIDTFEVTSERGGRGPVSVGVGGGTGSFGSGVGVGLGINLGGGAKPRIGTEIAIALKPSAPGGTAVQNLWEGRAQIEVAKDAAEDSSTVIAPLLAKALFRDFPGGNGDTTTVKVEDIQSSE